MRPRLVLALVLALVAAAPPNAGAVVVGIGDQHDAMFSDPRFLALHVHEARLTVPWDVASARSNHGLLAAAGTWLAGARRDGVSPLISFSGQGNFIPTAAQYTRAVVRFIRRYPWVRRYTAWNEPDWIYRRISREPRLAAAFYNTLARHCHGCTVLAGDLYLPARDLGRWIRAYRRYLHPRPAGWALHDYYDVRTHTTHQLQVMLRLTRGPIWLDEISGVESRGHWRYASQSAGAAARDERFLFSLPRRFPRISRIYHYEWRDSAYQGPRWDSSLESANGRPRPAYFVVAHAASP